MLHDIMFRAMKRRTLAISLRHLRRMVGDLLLYGLRSGHWWAAALVPLLLVVAVVVVAIQVATPAIVYTFF